MKSVSFFESERVLSFLPVSSETERGANLNGVRIEADTAYFVASTKAKTPASDVRFPVVASYVTADDSDAVVTEEEEGVATASVYVADGVMPASLMTVGSTVELVSSSPVAPTTAIPSPTSSAVVASTGVAEAPISPTESGVKGDEVTLYEVAAVDVCAVTPGLLGVVDDDTRTEVGEETRAPATVCISALPDTFVATGFSIVPRMIVFIVDVPATVVADVVAVPTEPGVDSEAVPAVCTDAAPVVAVPTVVTRLPVAGFFVDVTVALPVLDGMDVEADEVVVVPDAILPLVPAGVDVVDADGTGLD